MAFKKFGGLRDFEVPFEHKADKISSQRAPSSPCINCMRGCAVQARHIFSTSKDVQYESGTSSAQARMCSTSEARGSVQLCLYGGVVPHYLEIDPSAD